MESRRKSNCATLYRLHMIKFQAVNQFRNLLGLLACYDWVTIPLVYTQVAHISVRAYFIICLMARQYLDNRAYSKPEVRT